ncbi:hypothetical protein [Pseudotamlana carrageenivorans]|uniref:Uncharacterized protein n=1 Tax=Pseudotamlana carrageenivorans TaxID=2069432 RepID=A0A2I7SES6_9FLAO|nr:hypothetical protein [Tamlana carrageenivorans]AUS04398.1 hypothetical protein C1A40_02430 [Tamlana carrageenivorans]
MAEITLKYDARNSLAKKTLDYILKLGVFKKVTGIDEALEDEKKGRVTSHASVDDYFKKMKLN